MGGPGAGHKSERARRSRLVNIQKARAARKRAPLPWRSGVESRIIEQLVWQWWKDKNSGQWLVASGQKKTRDGGRGTAFGGGWVRRDSESRAGAASSAPTKAKRPWAKYRVARLLGVSHTWVNKLVRRIEADPERTRRKMRAFAPATFEKLERAREETRRERERGWLRGPIRWRRVKVTLEGRKSRVGVPTRAEMKRRGALRQEMQRDSASRAGRVNPAPTKANAAPVRYSELPQWASGLPLLGGTGIAAGQGPGMRTPATAGKPRPVPFAFRRRR